MLVALRTLLRLDALPLVYALFAVVAMTVPAAQRLFLTVLWDFGLLLMAVALASVVVALVKPRRAAVPVPALSPAAAPAPRAEAAPARAVARRAA